MVAGHSFDRGVSPEIELRRRRVAAVASDAIAGHEGENGLSELALQIGIGRFDRSRGENRHAS